MLSVVCGTVSRHCLFAVSSKRVFTAVGILGITSALMG
ncbi:hypothetical protein BN903_202 [Halorubrum sp. AJ67]|nr:hypothetical protein BN903_202 [Halorubrum sp. AJ67]